MIDVVRKALAPRLLEACPDLSLRAEDETDVPFLAELYASTRAEEMATVLWPPGAVQAFLREQFTLQRRHYRAHYLGAEFLVIERAARPIGRLYLHRVGAEIRLMDIALLPARRGQGIGTRLLDALLDCAAREACEVTLHVEPHNPVLRLYRRRGFRLIEDRGVYLFMGRRPGLS